MSSKRLPKTLFWILAASAVLRFAGVARPLTGNFSSVQVIYAMMARNFPAFGWNLFLPRLDLIWNGEQGIRLLDLPLISYGVAILHAFTHLPIDLLGRFWSGIFSLASIVFYFKLIRVFADEKLSLTAAFFFAFSPLSIIYGQSFQTDATSIFLLLTSLLCIAETLAWPQVLYSGFLMSMVLLLRIQYVFLFPVFLIFFYNLTVNKKELLTKYFIWGLLSGLPLLLWNQFIYYYLHKDFDHIAMSIYHQVGTGSFAAYKPWSTEFIKTFSFSLAKLLLNPFGLILLFAGVFLPYRNRLEKILGLWIVLILGMLLVLTKKSMDMNYYLLGLLPPAAYFAAKALCRLEAIFHLTSRRTLALLFLIGILSIAFAASAAYRTPHEDLYVKEAGEFVNQIAPQNVLVVAANGTNPNLLFYTKRKGWAFPISNQDRGLSPYFKFHLKNKPMSEFQMDYLKVQKNPIDEIEYYRKQGARYFVCVRPEQLLKNSALESFMTAKFHILKKKSGYVIYDLQ